MKKSVFILSLVFTLLSGSVLHSQNAEFTEKNYDFGAIVESENPVSHKFEVTNNGDKPLVISNVRGCCGLTISGWTKEPIDPKGKGFVEATIHTRGRRGGFNKTVTVFTNGTPQSTSLTVRGNIVNKPIDPKVEYPLNIGLLRLKKNEADFALINKNDGIKTITVETINAETEPISFKINNIPDYYTVTAEPATLQPKQKGLIRITFDPSKKKTLGFSKDMVAVSVGEQKGDIKLVSTLIEKSTIAAEQSPRFVLKERTFDFGTAKKGKAITSVYEITNDGKGDLILHNVTTDSKDIKTSVNNMKIKPGKSNTIKLSYNVGNQAGAKNLDKIFLTTNDPSNPIVTLNLKGNVE